MRWFHKSMRWALSANIFIARDLSGVPGHSIVFFPLSSNVLSCGLVGIVAFKSRKNIPHKVDLKHMEKLLSRIEESGTEGGELTKEKIKQVIKDNRGKRALDLMTTGPIDLLSRDVFTLKNGRGFFEVFRSRSRQVRLKELIVRLEQVIRREEAVFIENMGTLSVDQVSVMSRRIESLRDISWSLSREVLGNVKKVQELLGTAASAAPFETVRLFKHINAALNSLERLEVRGRDSAGISLALSLPKNQFQHFEDELKRTRVPNLLEQWEERLNHEVLVNRSIRLTEAGDFRVNLFLTYKVAAEIGRLGDNIAFLRNELASDHILKRLASVAFESCTVSAHTRWASVGAITEPNCHPVDNGCCESHCSQKAKIYACLNGDIDNYRELRHRFEKNGHRIPAEVTTDTKIIPLQIQMYLDQGYSIDEAFRLAVNDFHGSHAITMLTNLAPGKLFLAQKGSGQAIFIGLAQDHYIPASEVYGFVEETPFYLKMNGEKEVDGKATKTTGQIFIIDPETGGGLAGIEAKYYDGTPVRLTPEDIKWTEITPRDIDRQGYPHYFLKEIGESPASVQKTLANRWKFSQDHPGLRVVHLNETVIPPKLETALREDKIRRIFFIGQGTAGVAARVCADILNYYLDDPLLSVTAVKASEMSGFLLKDGDGERSLEDTLVIAVSQSGTTTDTNRTVDMVRERGAHTLAIVNRRDSDITFKVDGVMYTSSGRDIEMSVASTKAFYSQIAAGALISLYIAGLKRRRSAEFINKEISHLLMLPEGMRQILSMQKQIAMSAERLAVSRLYWATVGSGPNKAAADEIRIKLSELCYKTISSDYIEDKKHIDLSSEPLILICAAGAGSTVIGDIVKDTAIFKAHKAATVVICDEGENRFDPYADDVFQVPRTQPHLASIFNTLVGHLWGYYAALSIDQGSRFLDRFREELKKMMHTFQQNGLSAYEVVLEKSFREKILAFYTEFIRLRNEDRLPDIMGLRPVSDLTLLLKYLAGRLPLSDFAIDFGRKGTAMDMLDLLFECLGKSINALSRPVDAIKHQAKTVTVGTSRISEKFEGVLFEALSANSVSPVRLAHRNVMVLKNLQGVISGINGSILYRIDGLNLLGEPTGDTTISVLRKEGMLRSLHSRVEKNPALKGTKRIIVAQGNVYIGKGLKDGRNILIVPVLSDDPAAPHNIAELLLLNVSFKDSAALQTIVKALGGKYEHIKNIVQENNIAWQDHMLTTFPLEDLFGRSAEKIADAIKAEHDKAQSQVEGKERKEGFIFTGPSSPTPPRTDTAFTEPLECKRTASYGK